MIPSIQKYYQIKKKNIYLFSKSLKILLQLLVMKLFKNYSKVKSKYKIINKLFGKFVLLSLGNNLIFIMKMINRILCLVAILVFLKHLSEIIRKKLIRGCGKWYFMNVYSIVNNILKELMLNVVVQVR